MSTFTTISKNRISWEAPPSVAVGEPEVDFIFSDATDFLFSDAVDYVFKEATSLRTETAWTPITRNKTTY